MSKRLATVKISYRQNKGSSLDVDTKVPQWIANQLAVRYLELLDLHQKSRKKKETHYDR